MAVVWTEAVKLGVCVGAQLAVVARTAGARGLGFRAEALHQAHEILGRSTPMLVPAALFVMQQARAPPCPGQMCRGQPVGAACCRKDVFFV